MTPGSPAGAAPPALSPAGAAPSEPSAARVVTIASGSIRAELLPGIGARLHRLTVFGHELLRTPDDPQEHLHDPFRWGGYVMAPWCNRIDPVPTDVGGVVVDVPANSSDGTALHGQVYMAAWEELGEGTFWVRGGGAGWPWPYETTLRVTTVDTPADAAIITFEQVLTNLGDRSMPGGVGFHPWFRGPLEVRIAAARVLPSNLAAGEPIVPVAGDFDLRVRRAMPVDLDATWLDPADPPVALWWPDPGVRARLEVASDAGLCIVAASPAGADAVAVEPETHAPQGLRRLLTGAPHGLAWLAPGGSIHLTTRMIFERGA
ncbi:MAG: hypothetical protein V4515_08605 [Chloroflexota bacterium]